MAIKRNPNLSKSIGCNIKKFRELKFPGHGGQKKCAEAFSKTTDGTITSSVWSDWEKGRVTPSEARLLALAKFFGVKVSQIRGDEKAPDAKAPGAESVTYDAVVNACLFVQAAISDVLLHLNRERDLEPYREDLKDLADTARSLQELLSDL